MQTTSTSQASELSFFMSSCQYTIKQLPQHVNELKHQRLVSSRLYLSASLNLVINEWRKTESREELRDGPASTARFKHIRI